MSHDPACRPFSKAYRGEGNPARSIQVDFTLFAIPMFPWAKNGVINDVLITTIEWHYSPASFFEQAYALQEADYKLRFDNGLVTATLKSPADPLPTEAFRTIEQRVRGVMEARMITVHQQFTLGCATTAQQYPDGRRGVTVHIKGVARIALSEGRADAVVMDAAGNVIRDTKRERIERDAAFVERVGRAMERSGVLKALLQSYGAAVSDPSDELVHLYEITERLAAHLGGEEAVFQKLGFPKGKWTKLRRLANQVPVRQSRHRGSHDPGVREATKAELEEARSIARDLIYSFAGTV